jgi:hypothetical protein
MREEIRLVDAEVKDALAASPVYHPPRFSYAADFLRCKFEHDISVASWLSCILRCCVAAGRMSRRNSGGLGRSSVGAKHGRDNSPIAIRRN